MAIEVRSASSVEFDSLPEGWLTEAEDAGTEAEVEGTPDAPSPLELSSDVPREKKPEELEDEFRISLDFGSTEEEEVVVVLDSGLCFFFFNCFGVL